MDLIQYLKKHTIISVGNSVNKKCVMVEMIPDNSEKLIKYVIKNGYYIPHIHWWDRALIDKGSKIGYGGTADPRDPQNYFFAETDICASFKTTTTFDDYVEYLEKVKKQYSAFDIYPAFDIYTK